MFSFLQDRSNIPRVRGGKAVKICIRNKNKHRNITGETEINSDFKVHTTGPNEHIISLSHDIQTELQFILDLENSMWHKNLNLKHLYAIFFFPTRSDYACEIHLIGFKKASRYRYLQVYFDIIVNDKWQVHLTQMTKLIIKWLILPFPLDVTEQICTDCFYATDKRILIMTKTYHK